MRSLVISLVITGALVAGSFTAGVWYSRHQIRSFAEEVASTPTNSFTRCLVEQWELSGELRQDWKGKRRWTLTEPQFELPEPKL